MSPPSPRSPTSPAHVRPLRPTDIPAASHAQARAFRTDACLNWFGSVPADSPLGVEGYRFESLRIFLAGLTGGMLLQCGAWDGGGAVDVVVRPVAPVGGAAGEGDSSCVVPGRDGSSERLCACAMWAPADQPVGGLWVDARSGAWRSWWRWGWAGYRRIHYVYSPACERVFEREFYRRGRALGEAVYLVNIAVDPEEQGKGYTTLLMQAAFARWPGRPMMLEASSVKSRDVYTHYGFEVVEVLKFSVGEVTARGVPPREGEVAEGMTLWVMIKWS